MPAPRRSRASEQTARSRGRRRDSRQRRKPNAGAAPGALVSASARSSPGATSAAMKAASMGSVPDPQSGSRKLPPAAASCGHAAKSSTAAARFSLSGASTCTLSVR